MKIVAYDMSSKKLRSGKLTAYNENDNFKTENTVVALGKFEGLHRGHMLLLEEIVRISRKEKLTSVVLTVNVPSDKVINVPLERFMILENTGVDIACECEFTPEFAAMAPEKFVEEILVSCLGARYIVVGKDFRFGCKRTGNVDTLVKLGSRFGFDVIAFDKLRIDGNIISSSLIKELISEGCMEQVLELMGRSYSISGKVVHGKMLGRQIGFPTVNIIPDNMKLLPPSGVYLSHVSIDNRTYKGITNIGSNPTVNSDLDIRVETHIIDYSGDLYGQDLTVSLDKFLRGEIKFDGIAELKAQLEKDKQTAMHQ